LRHGDGGGTTVGTQNVPDRMLAGFVGGGGRWLIEAVNPPGSDDWPARWEVGDRTRADRKIWRVTYGRVSRAQITHSFVPESLDADEHGFDPAIELQRLLLTKLTLHDVKTRSIQAERPHKMIPPKVDLATLPLQGDTWAVLDARITGIGLDADMSGEFRPVIGVQVQLG
jgi:hypothetical protein